MTSSANLTNLNPVFIQVKEHEYLGQFLNRKYSYISFKKAKGATKKKKKCGKFDYIKIKMSTQLKTLSKVKRKAIDWEKSSVIITRKGLIFILYIELLQFKRKRQRI